MKKLLLVFTLVGSLPASINAASIKEEESKKAFKPIPKLDQSDSICGSIPAEEHFSPNEYIARLNGAYMVKSYPERYKQQYINTMVDIIRQFIEGLRDENLIDIETMERLLISIKNEKNTEMIEQVLMKIKDLK